MPLTHLLERASGVAGNRSHHVIVKLWYVSTMLLINWSICTLSGPVELKKAAARSLVSLSVKPISSSLPSAPAASFLGGMMLMLSLIDVVELSKVVGGCC